MKTTMPKMKRKKAKGGAAKQMTERFNAAKGGIMKSKRGGPKAAKKKVVKKK